MQLTLISIAFALFAATNGAFIPTKRSVQLTCQIGGLYPGGDNAACAASCVVQGYPHGGYCDAHQVCICTPSGGSGTTTTHTTSAPAATTTYA